MNLGEALALYGDLEQRCPSATSISDSSITSRSIEDTVGNVTMDSMMN